MVLKTEKGWVCPNCKRTKTTFTVERWAPRSETDLPANVMHFACESCHKHWGIISQRYQDVNDKDLCITFKNKWDYACSEARRGNHALLDDMHFVPGRKRENSEDTSNKAEELTEASA